MTTNHTEVTSHSGIILPHLHASADAALKQSLSEVERSMQLEEQLAQERAQHAQTRAALQEHQARQSRMESERKIEVALQAHSLQPKAAEAVVKLLLSEQMGELETDSRGRLRDKNGIRSVAETIADFLGSHSYFLSSEDKQAGGSGLDRARMTSKQKSDYIEQYGQTAFLRLPHSKPAPKK